MGDDQGHKCSVRNGVNNASPSPDEKPYSPTHTGEKPFTMHTTDNSLSIHTDEKPDEKPDSSIHTGEKHSSLTNTNQRPDSSLHVNDLADELLLLIFSRFTPQEISTGIAPVCSKWHSLSRETVLWKGLDLNRISSANAVQLFSTAPLKLLRSLKLRFQGNGDALLPLISIHCPGLTDLSLTGFSAFNVESLSALGKGCPKIERMELNLYARFEMPLEQCNIFEFFQNLRALCLTLDDVDTNTVPLFDCTVCAKLEKVKLGIANNLDSDRFKSYIEKLRPFIWCLFVEDGEELFADSYKAIGKCSKLTQVIIANPNELSDQSLVYFSKLPALEYFGFRYDSRLTSAGLIAAFTAKGNFQALKKLYFESVDVVNDDVIMAIADSCPQLIHIDLRYVSVSDRGVCRIVTKCSNLEELSLHCLGITDICLWSIPKLLPHLRKITLDECENIRTTFVDELKQARPDINIEFKRSFVA